MDLITFRPIGIISTPFQEPKGTPIQPRAAAGAVGTVKVFPEYCQGLQDLDGFSHIFLLYHFHHCQGFSLLVKPFLDEVQRGVFATRAPARPNPIGLSLVRLDRIEHDTLHVREVDILDGTPLLDINPLFRSLTPGTRPGSAGSLTTWRNLKPCGMTAGFYLINEIVANRI